MELGEVIDLGGVTEPSGENEAGGVTELDGGTRPGGVSEAVRVN